MIASILLSVLKVRTAKEYTKNRSHNLKTVVEIRFPVTRSFPMSYQEGIKKEVEILTLMEENLKL